MPDAKDNVLAELYGPQMGASVLGLRLVNQTRGAGCRSESLGNEGLLHWRVLLSGEKGTGVRSSVPSCSITLLPCPLASAPSAVAPVL